MEIPKHPLIFNWKHVMKSSDRVHAGLSNKVIFKSVPYLTFNYPSVVVLLWTSGIVV